MFNIFNALLFEIQKIEKENWEIGTGNIRNES